MGDRYAPSHWPRHEFGYAGQEEVKGVCGWSHGEYVAWAAPTILSQLTRV